MKVSYKKIRCNKNWNRCIVDHYYQLSAADFIPEEELTQNLVFSIIMRGKIRRGEIKQKAVFVNA